MSKHTPGPWRASVSEVESEAGQVFDFWSIYGPEGSHVCYVTDALFRKGDLAADVHLMAASPVLLEALENLEGRFDEAAKWRHNAQEWGDEEGWVEGLTLRDWFFAEVRAAIAKAKGETQ